MRFEVLATILLKIQIFWIVAPCWTVNGYLSTRLYPTVQALLHCLSLQSFLYS